jgi:hypothetical protein
MATLGTKTNVFKPQENKYLNNGPALDLVRTFLNDIIRLKKNHNIKNKFRNNNENENENPEIRYLQVSRDFLYAYL